MKALIDGRYARKVLNSRTKQASKNNRREERELTFFIPLLAPIITIYIVCNIPYSYTQNKAHAILTTIF